MHTFLFEGHKTTMTEDQPSSSFQNIFTPLLDKFVKLSAFYIRFCKDSKKLTTLSFNHVTPKRGLTLYAVFRYDWHGLDLLPITVSRYVEKTNIEF